MARSFKALEKSQKSSSLLKPIDTRDVLVLLFSLSASVLAFIDPTFRETYKEFLILVIGAYFGQLRPR